MQPNESSLEQLDNQETSSEWEGELEKILDKETEETDGTESDEPLEESLDDEPETELDDSETDEQSSPDDWKSKEYDVNGEKLSGAELASGYMKDADYRQKTAQVAQLRREFEQKTQHFSGELTKRANTLEVLSNALYRKIVGDQNQLSELVNTDPAEYVRRSHHLAEQNRLMQASMVELEQVKHAQLQVSESQTAEYAQEEYQKLVDVLPSWRDQKVADAEGSEIAQYLMNNGYEQTELNELYDHRALVLARKAMLYDKRAALKPVAPQGSAAIKPGSPDQQSSKNKQREVLRARAIKSQSRDDFVSALSAIYN